VYVNRTTQNDTLGLGIVTERGHTVLSNVDAGSVSHRAGLKVGEQIISVNNVSVSNMGHREVLERLMHGGLQLVVEVGRTKAATATQVVQGTLEQHPARVLLVKRKSKKDGYGVGFAQEGATLVVSSVVEGSAAFEAGIRVGDRVIGVDGKLVHQKAEADRALQGNLNTTIAVSSSDSATPRPRVLYVSRASKQEPLGMQCNTEGGVCTVESVDPAGVAHTAGVRKGDHIAGIGGKWSTSMSHEQVQKMFAKSAACFTLKTTPLLSVTRRRLAGSVRMAKRA
jgi:predicted metalloprotease with PDZ domain